MLETEGLERRGCFEVVSYEHLPYPANIFTSRFIFTLKACSNR